MKKMKDWRWMDAEAWHNPRGDFEKSLGLMLTGWALYADAHQEAYRSAIGSDRVLGEHWAAVGNGLYGLLNGEIGRFDCASLANLILGKMESNDVEED